VCLSRSRNEDKRDLTKALKGGERKRASWEEQATTNTKTLTRTFFPPDNMDSKCFVNSSTIIGGIVSREKDGRKRSGWTFGVAVGENPNLGPVRLEDFLQELE